MKCISLVWLARADLSSLNSGEGSGNLNELKTYAHGRKPYVSGQATRAALFETLARSYPEAFQCTPELPCTHLDHCWGCDLRGFLATEEGVGGERRWSPLKVTPGLGQLASEVVTDLLTRSSMVAKEGKESKDMRIAHVQMTQNIYRFGMVIDVANIGRQLVGRVSGSGKNQQFDGWEEKVNIGADERRRRVAAVLDAVYNLSGFAKQARAAASLAPDLVLLAAQPTYNQRGLKALELDEAGNVRLEQLQAALQEHQDLGHSLAFGYTPGVVANDGELIQLLQKLEIKALPVHQAFAAIQQLLEQVE